MKWFRKWFPYRPDPFEEDLRQSRLVAEAIIRGSSPEHRKLMAEIDALLAKNKK